MLFFRRRFLPAMHGLLHCAVEVYVVVGNDVTKLLVIPFISTICIKPPGIFPLFSVFKEEEGNDIRSGEEASRDFLC